MNTILESLSGIQWIAVARVMIDLFVKGAFLCGLAGAATLIMRRSPAFARKAVWVAVLAALIILPLSSFVAPAWDLPILPSIGGEILATDDEPLAKETTRTASLHPPVAAGAGSSTAAGLLENLRPIGIGWVALIWLAGVLVSALWFALSRCLITRLISKAEPLGEDWQGLMAELSGELAVDCDIRLLKSPTITAAMTAGILKPVIVLPTCAERWSPTRRRLVLSHELAHVKRWDAMLETLGFAATALHWFNPLAWLALSRLRIERERDCDNAVLNSGAKPSDYASLLMEIATDVQRRNRPVWHIATISEGCSLKDRLLCILDPKMDRRNGNLGSVFIIGFLVVAFTIPLSGSRLWKTAVVELVGGDDTKQEEVEKKLKEAQPCSEEELKEQELKKAQHKKQEKLKIAKPMNVREKLENDMKDDKTRGTSAARVIGLYAYDGGASAATKAYREFRADPDGGHYFDEKEFNSVGYLLLNVGKVDEAVAIFQMNVEMYPDSWNVYDSLGESYIKKGDLARATELYEKSLEINPDNDNGRKMLQMIEKKK